MSEKTEHSSKATITPSKVVCGEEQVITPESTELKSLVIDTEKGVYKVNGRDVSESGEFLKLEFEYGQWSLTILERQEYIVNDRSIKVSIC